MCDSFLLFKFRQLLFAIIALAAPILHAETWQTLKDCELVSGAYGDGDSFHIHSGSTEMIVRLYFVDTPETDAKYPDRVKDQADYFGLTPAETLKLGEKAAAFTRKLLAGRFTVVTQHEDARGNSNQPRYYSFVLLDDGKRNLAELLVENGLARLHGWAGNLPGGPDKDAEWRTLRRLEAKAKTQHLGGWGAGR